MRRTPQVGLAGAFLGAFGAFWLCRYLAILLLGVKPFDAITYLVVAAHLLATAAFARHIPGQKRLALRLFVAGRSGDAQKDQNRTIQPHHILVAEASDTRADLRLRNGRDLVHHQSADDAQAVTLVGIDG